MSILDNIIARGKGGGEYMKVDDIIARYPDGICISGLTTRDGKDKKDVPCFTFAEEPNKFFYASTKQLKELFDDFIDEAGDIATANADLAKEYLKIKMWRGRSKKTGNNFLGVERIGTVQPKDVKKFVDKAAVTFDSDFVPF